MTVHGAGIPAYENTLAEEPRDPGPMRRYASTGRRVAKATVYTFAIVFVTGIFVGLLMGMTTAHADDGGSGGDGGSSSSGSSSSSGGDGGSSSSSGGDGGSSSSTGGDGGSSDGSGGSGASTGTGDSSSSTGDGGSSSSTGTGDSSSSTDNGDSSASANDGDSSSSAVASGDTPSTTVNGEATSVDGISVSHVSVDSPDRGSAALGDQDAAVAAPAQQGEAPAAVQATETAAQSTAGETTDPSAAAAVPGTVVDNTPSFLSSADHAAMTAAAQVGSEQEPASTPAQPNIDDAVSTPMPGIMVDNAVSFLAPEDLATIRDIARVGEIDQNAPPVENPDAVIAEGVPGIVVDDAPSFLSEEDLSAIRAAAELDPNEDPVREFQPVAVLEDELGRQYVLGFDLALAKKAFGVRLGVQFDPPAIIGMVRAWPFVAQKVGFQGYALSLPGTKPGLESVEFFAQAQVPINPFASPKPSIKIGEGPVLPGVEVSYAPLADPDNRVTVTKYVGVQAPFTDTPIGAAWGIAMDHYNPVTHAHWSDEGHGWGIGGITGVAVGVRGALGLPGGRSKGDTGR